MVYRGRKLWLRGTDWGGGSGLGTLGSRVGKVDGSLGGLWTDGCEGAVLGEADWASRRCASLNNYSSADIDLKRFPLARDIIGVCRRGKKRKKEDIY